MYRIGEFSKMSKTTIKTLRYYDEAGLLKPEQIDAFTGYRLYTTDQLVRLHHIQSLRQAGLSIDETKCILAGHPAEDILLRRKAELAAELETCQKQLSRVEFMLMGQEEEQFMNYQAAIKQLPACTVYSKTMTVADYDTYFQLIPAIGEQVMNRYPDLKCAIPAYCFLIYLDGEYREKDIRVEFCEAIDQIKPDFDDICFRQMPPVTVVSVMHKGAYSNLSQAYAYAFKWIQENGYTVAGNPRESSIDGIWNKESVEDWLTELQIPIVIK